jgi:hypothetical protein
MASLFSFGEDAGTSTGSPSKGTTRNYGLADCNWKNATGIADSYSGNPITAGGNSFVKYQFGAISGSFNTISNGKWAHTSGTFGAGLTLRGHVTSGYSTPTTGTLGSGSDITATGTIAASGITVLFHSGGPEYAISGSISSVPTGYSQYLVTQLQTTTGAAPGDTATATLTFQFDES